MTQKGRPEGTPVRVHRVARFGAIKHNNDLGGKKNENENDYGTLQAENTLVRQPASCFACVFFHIIFPKKNTGKDS